MATVKTDFRCDLTKPVQVQYLDGNLFTLDNGGNTINVYCYEGEEPATLGGSVSANVIRPDGTTVPVSGAIDGNKAYVILPQAAYAVPGYVTIIIKVTQNTTVTTIAAIVANNMLSSTDTIVDPGTIVPSVQALIAQIEAAVGSIPADYSALLLMLAKNYSSSKPYIVGEYAWEAGVLKRCIVPITAGETYTAAHWTDACMGDDVSALKSAFEDVTGATLIDTGWNKGKRIATVNDPVTFALVTRSDHDCIVVDCAEGDVFTLTGKATNADYRLYCFTKTDGTIVKKPSSNLTWTDHRLETPANATKLIVNTLNSVDYKLYRGFMLDDEINLTKTEISNVQNSLDNTVDSIVLNGGIDLVTYLKVYSSGTSNGIQYTWNADGSCTISGEATDNSFNNIVGSTTQLLKGIIPGKKYHVDFHGGSVPVRLYVYNPSQTFSTHAESFDFTVPSDATAVLLRFQIADETVFSEAVTVKYTVTMIEEGAESNTTINNTYNITTSPTITTDTHGWLEAVDTETSSDTGKTDMTGAIMSMLNDTGYCHLGEGIFYVSGSIDMPSGSMLEGCGKKTKLRLLSSVETGYVVRMRDYCTLQNLEISGAYGASTPSTEGTRDGVWFEANCHDPDDVNEFTTSHCMISNVWILKFSGSGLYCHNTSMTYSKGIYVQNLYVSYCYKGINIDYYSEFNKFTNVCIAWCKIACVNNGGNNVFTACTFHATDTGFFIDGTQPNSAHGTLNGCTFCHIGSNAGKAIDMADITTGFIVSACQFWYNSINIKDSSGIVFSGCEFGRGTSGNGMNVNINGGGTVMFAGCMFINDVSKPPVFNFTNEPIVKFSGCFGGASGNEIDPTV